MAVQSTDRAAKELKKCLAEQRLPTNVSLRIGVSSGDCSEFEYNLSFDENLNPEIDSARELHGIRFVVDRKSSLHLDGTELDFDGSRAKRASVFNNPNAVESCGCGSSFSAQA